MRDFIDCFAVNIIKNMIIALAVESAIYNSGHAVLIQWAFKQDRAGILQASVKGCLKAIWRKVSGANQIGSFAAFFNLPDHLQFFLI